MKIRLLLIPISVFILVGCSSIYYGAMEKIGVHKRDIMVDRVKAARDSQKEAKKQFQSALEKFQNVVKYEGGDLEREYEKLKNTLERSEARAEEVRGRIESVEDVSEALFDEWQAEIKKYDSDELREASREKLEATKEKYKELIGAMKQAESRLEPVLVPLRDQVLFLKHNLNARAVAGLSGELESVQANVDKLVSDMEKAIREADAFIATLEEEK